MRTRLIPILAMFAASPAVTSNTWSLNRKAQSSPTRLIAGGKQTLAAIQPLYRSCIN
jgi:hypothetical protein